MNKLLLFATITITMALVFYTIGVWSERRAGTLKRWHVVTFWLGLLFDTTGTLAMERIARSLGSNINVSSFNFHGITGGIAIALMVFHAIWATRVIIKQDESKKAVFHKFSIVVWTIWLIPYFLGMFMGMAK